MNTQTLSIKAHLLRLQDAICKAFEAEDTQGRFVEDPWVYPEGGGGLTRILKAGAVFEKAGVNFSHIHGGTLPPAATLLRPHLAGQGFEAMGISVVAHPLNPYVPTVHFNLRFILTGPVKVNDSPLWWFGGGFDLTPYYPFVTDAVHWHQNAYAACQAFDASWYQEFKDHADRYFFLKHRNEARGIGGLFFDDFSRGGFDASFAFAQSIGQHFLSGYLPIVQKRKEHPYTEIQRNFQLYRRGRYVEFNLLQDRGTLFGLQSGGRTESILMSLPPLVSWEYGYQPQPHTPEAELYATFLKPQDWLNFPVHQHE